MSNPAPTRAILIAAGRGKRLGGNTDSIPKGMVPVGDAPIFGWQWRAMYAAGVRELVVIRGYLPDVMTKLVQAQVANGPGPAQVHFVDNFEWQTNNVMLSLACALPWLDRACLLSYSDIIFTPAVAQAAAQCDRDIGLVIDRDFRSIYHGRTEHPLEEGEVADLRPDGDVARVGKKALPPADAVGEFIGLVKLSQPGARALASRLSEVLATSDHNAPYMRAKTLRNGYLTDVLQDMIDRGTPIAPVFIDGQWREIDTPQDLERAITLVTSDSQWQT